MVLSIFHRARQTVFNHNLGGRVKKAWVPNQTYPPKEDMENRIRKAIQFLSGADGATDSFPTIFTTYIELQGAQVEHFS